MFCHKPAMRQKNGGERVDLFAALFYTRSTREVIDYQGVIPVFC